MHSNVGYIVTLALNLSLLLPLSNNPKVDNYVLVLLVLWSCCHISSQFIDHTMILGLMATGFLPVSGGVGLLHALCWWNTHVDFDFSHIPAAASWPVIAERRALHYCRMEAGIVSVLLHLTWCSEHVPTDMGCYETIQEAAIHIHISCRIFPACWCMRIRPSYRFNLIVYQQGLNTTGTLVSICQNDKFSFSFLYNTYLGLAQAVTSTIR